MSLISASVYQKLLNLQSATFSLIDHEEAMVATVFKIAKSNGEQFILKISKRPNDYFREVLFLKQFAEIAPVPKIIQLIEPTEEIHGAILMEYFPGTLLKAEDLTESLAYEIGRCLAIIHLSRSSGYGDPIQDNLTSDPRSYFTLKFEEGLDECRLNLPISLIEQCQDYYKANLDLLTVVDGPCTVHRDFRPGNIIVHEGKLKGIIDWAGARASFAEEDFCSLEHGEWFYNAITKKSFLSGYASIRLVPDYMHLIPFLRLNKAIATIGFMVKEGTWEGRCARIYQHNRQFIETLLKSIQPRNTCEDVVIDVSLVQTLIAVQFPEWKDLPVVPVSCSGWDNRTFHLGDKMLIRMPSTVEYEAQVEKEQYWLPKLSSSLPVQIPMPIAIGKPAKGYPWKWSIYGWIEGESVASSYIADFCELADNLAEFLIAFHRIDSTGGPLPGLHSFYRGGSLEVYDSEVKPAVTALKNKIDSNTVMEIWETALATCWREKPVWVHGDMSAGNLLVHHGKLCAVIDFGQLAIGDPACDLSIAWTLFIGKSRDVFRRKLRLDDETWARGRAWALWKALVVAAGFTNPGNTESAHCWRIINEVINDHQAQKGYLNEQDF